MHVLLMCFEFTMYTLVNENNIKLLKNRFARNECDFRLEINQEKFNWRQIFGYHQN